METIAILLIFCGLIGGLFYYSNKLSNKEFINKADDHFKPLLDELKNIDQLQFQTVSRDIIYSKTISVLLKTVAYLMLLGLIAFSLDLVTAHYVMMHNYSDMLSAFAIFLFVSFIISVLPLLSCTWDYTYFKYGLANQLKHADIAFEYIDQLPKKIIKKYQMIFIVSYLFGRIVIGSGFIPLLVGTFLYEIALAIYFTLEIKRIGFAPIFNLVNEKLDAFRGKKIARPNEQ